MFTSAEKGNAGRDIITVRKHSRQPIEYLRALPIIMRLRFGSLTFDGADFDGVPPRALNQ
jgi:hypothetical protein